MNALGITTPGIHTDANIVAGETASTTYYYHLVQRIVASTQYIGNFAINGSNGNTAITNNDGTNNGIFSVSPTDVLFQAQGKADHSIAAYGTNSNGSWVRFYSGLQVCWIIGHAANSISPWVYPAAFQGAPSIFGSTYYTSSGGSYAGGSMLTASGGGSQGYIYDYSGSGNLINGFAIGVWNY